MQEREVIPYRLFEATYRFHLQGSTSLTLEKETNILSQNFGKKLPLLAA
jgi:hypothetical protein